MRRCKLPSKSWQTRTSCWCRACPRFRLSLQAHAYTGCGLRKSPKKPAATLHRRVAEILRDRLPSTAAAAPEAIARHFTQAGLIDEAIEWWGNAGDQALRHSAFQEAITHLGKAIQMADKEEGGMPAEHTGKRHSRTHLQTTYGYALLHAQGHASLETRAAFDRASELAAGSEDAAERFSAYYGLWSGSFVRAELGPMREASEAFLRDV